MKITRKCVSGQGGVFAVEFALILALLLILVFSVMELARAMYIFNTLQEATRRGVSAAVNTNFRSEAALDQVRQQAIFRTSAGQLTLGAPITDKHIRIDYLSLVKDAGGSLTMTAIPAGSLSSCPARNRLICMSDPNDPTCVRFVRVRVCDPADASACNGVTYKPLVPLVDLPIKMPRFTAIATAESLGFTPGDPPCP